MEIKFNTVYLILAPDVYDTKSFTQEFSEGILNHIKSINDGNINFNPNMTKITSIISSLTSEKEIKTIIDKSTSYPQAKEFIFIPIVKPTKELFDIILKIVKDKDYNLNAVVANFKNKAYYSHSKELVNSVMSKANQPTKSTEENLFSQIAIPPDHQDLIKTFKGQLNLISKKHFDKIFLFSSPNLEEELKELQIKGIYDLNASYKNYTNNELTPFVIGDIHEQTLELKQLLEKVGCIIEDNKIIDTNKLDLILLGDLVDKGDSPKGIVEFIYLNLDKFTIVKGNHESFVYKTITGDLDSNSVNMEKETYEYAFSSIKEFTEDKELQEKFFRIYEKALPFLKISNPQLGISAFITHAPCENKYLGKVDDYSQRMQKNFRFTKRYDDGLSFETFYKGILKESDFTGTQPLHIFGHIPFLYPLAIYNKIALDTGCVYGNLLTGIKLLPNNKFEFISVNSSKQKKGKKKMGDLLKPTIVKLNKN